MNECWSNLGVLVCEFGSWEEGKCCCCAGGGGRCCGGRFGGDGVVHSRVGNQVPVLSNIHTEQEPLVPPHTLYIGISQFPHD